MKVLLLKNVAKIGKKFEVKDVSDGFARNYLFPQKLAKTLAQGDLAKLEEYRAIETQKAERSLANAQEIIEKIDGLELEMKVKASNEGKLYGGVNAQKISTALKERGYEVEKGQVKLEDVLKDIGEFEVILDLEHGLEAKIKVIIEAE